MSLTQAQIEHLARHREEKIRKLKGFQSPEPPSTIEVEYMMEMRGLTREITLMVEKTILPVLEEFETEYSAEQFRDADFRSELLNAFAVIDNTLSDQTAALNRYALGIATKFVSKSNRFNRRKWVNEINKLAGVDIGAILNDKALRADLMAAVDNNVALIKTLQPEYLDEVKAAVTEGIDRGDDFFSVKNRLAEIESFDARYRPKLIARDQSSKLTGDLNRLRQVDLGIKEYVWHTVQDGAVRQSHKDNDGKVFSWTAPPGTGHPGQDVNCRCVAEPVFPKWIDDVSGRKSWTPDDPSVLELKRIPRTPAPRFRPPTRPGVRPVLRKPRTGEAVALSKAQQESDQLSRFVGSRLERFDMLSEGERRKALQWNWVHGSNRKVSVGMKEAIKKEFGLKGAVYNPRKFDIPAARVKEFRGDVRAMYDATQKELRKRGIRHVKVYRGVTKDVVGSGVLESWTTNPKIAAKFGKNVMVKNVPADKIFSFKGSDNWVDGIWGNQSEVVVMG